MRIIIIGAGEVGYHVARTLCRDNDVFIIETAKKGSKILNKKLKDVRFPRGAIVSAIVRNMEVIIPGGNHTILSDDKVVIFALPSALPAVEELFS